MTQRTELLIVQGAPRTFPSSLSALGSKASAFCILGTAVASTAMGFAGDPEPGDLLQVKCLAVEAATGVIGDTIPLQLDTDGRMDVVAQVGDELVWVASPDPLQYSSPVGIPGVTAFAGFQRTGSTIGALVVASTSGLEYVMRDMESLRQFDPVATGIGGAEWASARSVVTADFDGDGDTDIAGLSADGATLLRLDQVFDATFVTAPAVPLGVELSELSALRWSGGGTALAGIMGTAQPAVAVFDTDGIVLDSVTVPGAESLTVLRDGETAGVDSVAVLGGGMLTVVRPGGVVEPSVNLMGFFPTAMGAGDVNGDGLMDLACNSTTEDQLVVLLAQDRNVSSGQSFSSPNAATSITFPLDQDLADMSGQRAMPALADFDRDGDTDIFQLLEGSRGGCLQRNSLVNEVLGRPSLVDGDFVLDPAGSMAFLEVAAVTMDDGQLPDQLEFILSTSAPDASADDIQTHRLRTVYDVGSVTTGQGLDQVTLQIPGELGAFSTLFVRGLRAGAAGSDVSRVGTDSVYQLVRLAPLGTRGTDSGIDISGIITGGPQGTPPPPPPVPIDPFS